LEFWVATGSCTDERWKTDDPNIRIVDYALEQAKTCRMDCQHKMVLHPGQTVHREVRPSMSSETQPCKRVIRFVNLQPGLVRTNGARTNTNGSAVSPVQSLEPRPYGSNPLILDIRKEWLGSGS
jgi:hypothetical protein